VGWDFNLVGKGGHGHHGGAFDKLILLDIQCQRRACIVEGNIVEGKVPWR
jgi:hypothetical protein